MEREQHNLVSTLLLEEICESTTSLQDAQIGMNKRVREDTEREGEGRGRLL